MNSGVGRAVRNAESFEFAGGEIKWIITSGINGDT